MVAPAPDSNIRRLIEDLDALQAHLGEAEEDNQQDRLIAFIAAFLTINGRIIERAVGAWEETSEAELAELEAEHRELDHSATSHGFGEIAMSPVRTARVVLESPLDPRAYEFTSDELHMLDRVLEFAKYLTDTSDLELH